MKKQMKKVLCVMLSILMAFSYAVPAFAGVVDNTSIGTKQAETKDAEVKAVEKKIDAIGKVHYTDKSLAKIIVAENAYNALSDDQKTEVLNYGTLKSAKDAYDALKADNVDTSSYTITDSGSINEELKWFVYDNGMLEISGSGSIPNYSTGSAPWYQYRDSITSVLVCLDAETVEKAVMADILMYTQAARSAFLLTLTQTSLLSLSLLHTARMLQCRLQLLTLLTSTKAWIT